MKVYIKNHIRMLIFPTNGFINLPEIVHLSDWCHRDW